jgi:hypothetical protein
MNPLIDCVFPGSLIPVPPGRWPDRDVIDESCQLHMCAYELPVVKW